MGVVGAVGAREVVVVVGLFKGENNRRILGITGKGDRCKTF